MSEFADSGVIQQSVQHAEARRWEHRLLWVVLASTVLRIIFAMSSGLGVDESYASTVSLPFSLSYFDHPPLHFWMVGSMIELSGSTHALLVRLPFVLCFSATLFLMGRLGMRLFGARAGVFGAIALAVTAVPGITSGTWVLPDGPLLLGASAAALLLAPIIVPGSTLRSVPLANVPWASVPFAAFTQARMPIAQSPDYTHPSHAHEIWRWIATGVALAIALLSKYHAVLFIAALMLYVLSVSSARVYLRTPGPYLMLCIALLAAVPVLWWNASHDWVSFTFHGARATTQRAWSLAPLAENIAGQTAWLLPWNAPLLLIALLSAWRAGPRDPARWYCALLASGPIVLFTAITLTGARGLPHWQSPGWMFAAPLVGHLLDRACIAGRRWPTLWLGGSTVATAALVLVISAHTATGMLTPLFAQLRVANDPTHDALDWRPLADTLQAHGLQRSVVYAPSWIQAGKVGVALGPEADVRCACDDQHHFAFRGAASDGPPQQALLVEHVQPWRKNWQPASITLIDRLGPLDSLHAVAVQRGGHEAVTLVVYRIQNP